MLVLTTHSAVERRQAIRQTWASFTQNNTAAKLRHVFLLGRSRDARHMRSVQEEQAKYGDIVMHDYIDSYGNLTLKTLSGFHWLLKNCPNIRFFLKVDDDVWMNVPTLLNLLQTKDTELQTAIGGTCFHKIEPIRNNASKWYASFESYPHPHYPATARVRPTPAPSGGAQCGASVTGCTLLPPGGCVHSTVHERVWRQLRLEPRGFQPTSMETNACCVERKR
ncbi:hypothetical protein C0Q70_16445 [Pomacea canaliculata]|uniref:Hexosyltransferase n=2 Tax=Pomacea canaliculata TaxID=400727 RepID=A0A2T7NPV2_POMCA|nr:hypothetical protein C0Q70_16445 [Pomacea canaliculata]